MCKQYLLAFCFLTVFCFTASAPPPSLTKCKSDDEKCILQSSKALIPIFAAGMPEYNVPSSDPLKIKSINASEGNLLFLLNDITVVGLKNCEAKKISRDGAKSKLFIKLLCSATLDGQYQLQGSLLLLPIEGNGAVHADLKSALFKIEADIMDKDGEDGKKHWHIKTWSHTFELLEKSNVVFENLYKDNELLARAARNLVRDNGNEIIKEIGPKVVKALMTKVLKSVNTFFKAVPIEDLSVD